MSINDRVAFFSCHNGNKANLPFSDDEYNRRLFGARELMAKNGLDALLLTSMHNIAYYSGFLYCAFGRAYGCIITHDDCVTISANIDAGEPWRRSIGENIIYTDWQRDNYWRAVKHVLGSFKNIGIESDHMTLSVNKLLQDTLPDCHFTDISAATMQKRMVKSGEEIALIKEGARIANVGGEAIIEAIAEGVKECEVAAAGRNAMEIEIANTFPDSELRDTWVWFQSGINTDGAHNPLTTRELQKGDILSLNSFPMISGYYTALERTLFLGEPDTASLKIWEINAQAHTLGMSLIKPGASCSDICAEINEFFASHDLLKYRSFGYGHSFGVLSHYYGREAGLELREDIHTVLEPDMVISMEPMLWLPEGNQGAGGYREHDILVVNEKSAENITNFRYGSDHLTIGA